MTNFLEVVAVDMALAQAGGAPWPWISAADRSAESLESFYLKILRALPRRGQESPEASAAAYAAEWVQSLAGSPASDRQYTVGAIVFLLSREMDRDDGGMRYYLEWVARNTAAAKAKAARAEFDAALELDGVVDAKLDGDAVRAAVASCGDIDDDTIDKAFAAVYGRTRK